MIVAIVSALFPLAVQPPALYPPLRHIVMTVKIQCIQQNRLLQTHQVVFFLTSRAFYELINVVI
jgi:hypothetical protein